MKAKSNIQKTAATKKAEGLSVHDVVELSGEPVLPVDLNTGFYVNLSGYKYIPFFAPDDSQFRKLLTMRLLSPTQGACIGDKAFYATGEGLQVRDQEFPTNFDKKINSRRQRLDDILKLIFDGLLQDGNKFVEVVRMNIAGRKVVHVYEHANLDCRLEEPEDGYEPTHVLRSREFRRAGIMTKPEGAVRIPLWTDMPVPGQQVWAPDPQNKNVERTMFHLKRYVSGIDGYGLPSNFHGLMQVALEYKAARFNVDNFDNNMFLGGILMIQGSMNDTEEKKLVKNIKKMHTGDGKYNRILPISSEGGITDTKFVPFSDKQDGHFIELDRRNEEKIIGANQWSKELLDLKNQSGLGKGGDYLVKLFKAKYATVIKPMQEDVMNDFVWPLMSIIDEWTGSTWSGMEWYIKPAIPIAFEGALDVNSLLTVDEGRDEIGKAPLGGEEGKKLISAAKAPASKPEPTKEEEEL